MRFTPTGPDKTIEDTRARLANYRKHQDAHGFSKWIILDAISGDPIGDSGLLVLEEYGWIDLGFRLAKQHWGKGLATEAAAAWVQAAFQELNFARLGAFAHPENMASSRVLKKVGFHPAKLDQVMGMDAIVYFLEASDHPVNPLASSEIRFQGDNLR